MATLMYSRPKNLENYNHKKPFNQTPKFVITKNINAPVNAPIKRKLKVLQKYFDINPIIITLPQVNNSNE